MAKNNLSLIFIVLFISQGCKAANTKHIIKITDAFEESEDTRNLGKAQRADERINISFPGKIHCVFGILLIYISFKSLINC